MFIKIKCYSNASLNYQLTMIIPINNIAYKNYDGSAHLEHFVLSHCSNQSSSLLFYKINDKISREVQTRKYNYLIKEEDFNSILKHINSLCVNE